MTTSRTLQWIQELYAVVRDKIDRFIRNEIIQRHAGVKFTQETEVMFYADRLKQIRDNWKDLFAIVNIIIAFSMTILSFSNDGVVISRTVAFLFLFLTFFGLNHLISKNDFLAKYCGCIITVIVSIIMTEVNVKFTEYKLYEGFMTQVALGYMISSCVSIEWKLCSLSLILSYAYFLIRMAMTYGDAIPENLYIACIEATTFHSISAYMLNRTLQREFMAKYKNIRSSTNFKKFLHTLPEGVVIMEQNSSNVKFVNSKFKNYSESASAIEEMIRVNSEIDNEFDSLMRERLAEDDLQALYSSSIENLMKQFKVVMNPEINQPSLEGSNDPEDEGSMVRQNLYKNGKKIVSLKKFLVDEQKSLKQKGVSDKECKVEMFMQDSDEELDEEVDNKQFIIKTKQVILDEESESEHPLFIHLFIDTTQITQLEEIKAQNRYQRQMLANVSHEFRTPLNAIMMSLALLKTTTPAKDAKFLKIADSSCSILAALVEDILDHAKIESGVFEIHETGFTVEDLFDEVQSIFELQAQRKGIILNFCIHNQLKCKQIMSDKQRLKQILLNLISNAFKFTDKGYIKVDIYPVKSTNKIRKMSSNNRVEMMRSGEVPDPSLCYSVADEGTDRNMPNIMLNYNSNSFQRNNMTGKHGNTMFYEESKGGMEFKNGVTRVGKLCMTVEDTGLGIHKKDQESLFKLFGKLTSNHNRNKTGCGLGLTICKKILEKLNGDIILTSQENFGTKVKCTFEYKY